MFNKVILLNKKEGETPLEALEAFRSQNKKYRDVKMTYAGRLDPMASGLLLLLAGEEVKNKEKYLKLPKEYEFEVLFGFATDTYDILGKVTHSLIRTNRRIVQGAELEKKIRANLKFFTGKFIQKYPPYSSKTVKGKSLFQYARAGEEVEAQRREVFVKSLKLLKIRKISNTSILQKTRIRIKKIKGDFRQEEILKIWHQALNVKHSVFDIASFKIKCSSGTYVRGIANSLGEKMDIPALAYSIKRTKVGRYSVLK